MHIQLTTRRSFDIRVKMIHIRIFDLADAEQLRRISKIIKERNAYLSTPL